MKHMKNDKAGVSPVIATLILVLIAVAAGVAFFAWQSGWQEDATQNISNADTKTQIVIGGSTTVYPFTEIAAEMFMAENPTVQVSFQAGGSGAGLGAVRAGVIDIGSYSAPVDSTGYPDEVVVKVATDAIVMIVHPDMWDDLDDAGITGFTRTQIREIYAGTITDWDEIDATLPAEPIVTYDRSDVSGTEEAFGEKIIGGQKQIATPYVADFGVPSNQEMIPAIAGNQYAIGFVSFGVADLNKATVSMIGFGIDAASVRTGEVAGPIVVPSKTTIKDGTYTATRPLNYVYYPDQVNSFVVKYIEFCLQPEYNLEINKQADYFAIY